MYSFDIIIKNGTILTMDSKCSVLKRGLVCIEGDTISHICSDDENTFEADKIINAKGGLILPGLVNAHTHAAMSLPFQGPCR